MLFPDFFEKVVIVYEEGSRDKRVKFAAIAINVIFLTFYCDFAGEIDARLFEAKFFAAIDGLPINECHMLLKEIRTWRAFEVIKDEMLSFIGVFDERLDVNTGAMEISIIFKQVLRDSGCSV